MYICQKALPLIYQNKIESKIKLFPAEINDNGSIITKNILSSLM